jgi:hypothetical protein
MPEVITVHNASGLALHGNPSKDHSWFSGYDLLFSATNLNWQSQQATSIVAHIVFTPTQRKKFLQIYVDNCIVCCLWVKHWLAIQGRQEDSSSEILLGDTQFPNFRWYTISTGPVVHVGRWLLLALHFSSVLPTYPCFSRILQPSVSGEMWRLFSLQYDGLLVGDHAECFSWRFGQEFWSQATLFSPVHAIVNHLTVCFM